MFEISSVKQENLKNVSAPFSMDVMREFFMDKEKVFVVNYEESQLQGNSLLIYLSNLDIPCEIEFSENVSKEQRFELLKCYMESRNLYSIPSFTKTWVELLLLYKGSDYEKAFATEFLTVEEQREFIEQNKELIEKSVRFCDSLPFFLITTTRAYQDKFGEEIEDGVDVVDDPFFVGQNVVDMFFLRDFFELYFAAPTTFKPTYFKRQFREMMFRGRNLFHHFYNPNNTMVAMLMEASDLKVDDASKNH